MNTVIRRFVLVVPIVFMLALCASAETSETTAITQTHRFGPVMDVYNGVYMKGSIVGGKSFASLQESLRQEASLLAPGADDELGVIAKMVRSTPRARRNDGLRRIASRTKWGTSERAVAYYVCAWYNVDFRRCRDYLLNGLFEYGWDPRVQKFKTFNGSHLDEYMDLRNLLYLLQVRSNDPYLRHQLLFVSYDERAWPAVKREMSLLRNTFSSTPPASRTAALWRLASRTKWGTPERATAYYMCAWYGANYECCRDYLLNTLFWGEKRFPRLKREPFTWSEDTVELLYELYERNHDFVLLHDLLIGGGDGAVAEVLDGVHLDALSVHPRGVLHAATISQNGFRFALGVMMDRFFADADRAELDKGVRIFNTYVTRVAADSRDPLNVAARKLLAGARRSSHGKQEHREPARPK